VFVPDKQGYAQVGDYSFYEDNNFGANSPEYGSVVDIVDSLLAYVYTFHRERDSRYGFGIVDSVFIGSFMRDTIKELFEKFYNYKINKASKDYGLKLTGFYNYNFQPGFSDDEELYYRQRAYVGVDWNLLDNGFFGNREQVEKMKIDLQVNRFEKEREMARENFIYRYNYITFIFNRLKIQLIERRLDVLDGLGKIATELFYKRSITWEDVLKIKEKINRLELEHTGFYDYNWYYELDLDVYPEKYLKLKKMPFLDVNLIEMMSLSEVNNLDSALSELKLEQIGRKYSAMDGMMLRTFVRYNFQQGFDDDNRSFGSVGLSAGIPLKFGPHRNIIMEAEKELFKAEEREGAFFRKSDLLKLYHEYQNKKYQLVSLYFKKARFGERIRKETVAMESRNPDFSPLKLLVDLDEKMAVEMELTDLLRTQYLTVLQLQELLNGAKVSSFVHNMEVEELVQRYCGSRSLFLQHDTFSAIDNASLLNDFKLNEIDEVFLSAGDFGKKLTGLLNSASVNDIAVFNLIGDNALLFYPAKKLELYLSKALEYRFSGIHMNIEPYKFSDWEEREDIYMAMLIELYSRAFTFAKKNNLRFSVSIPDFLPEKYIKLIYQYADRVMVTAYNITDSKVIIRNLQEEFAASRERSALVVRPGDFSSRIEMEAVLEKVMDDTGVKCIAIQDLSGLRKLEKSGYSSRSPQLMYRIQIAASKKEIPSEKMKQSKGVEQSVSVFYADDYYKYTILEFDMYEEALKKLYEIKQKRGLEDAFLFRAIK
jgi:hypothetical protein